MMLQSSEKGSGCNIILKKEEALKALYPNFMTPTPSFLEDK
jgi:hypothetical protein